MTQAANGLIALDMDGTLLDGAGLIPDGFWPLMALAAEKGVVIAPASGRQLTTLRDLFEAKGRTAPEAYIAENGTVVYHDGEIVSTTPIEQEDVHTVLDAAAPLDAAVVVCRPESAFILTGHDKDVVAEIRKYYHAVVEVEDLHSAVNTDVVKLALYTRGNSETDIAPALRAAAPELSTPVSGKNWVDVMNPLANKGIALTALASALGVTPTETVAFGDYLNDLELLQAAGTAYAMENAHPDIKAIADRIAPPNTEHGVVTELRVLLDG